MNNTGTGIRRVGGYSVQQLRFLLLLILFHDRIELDKLALMVLSIIDQLGKLFTNRLDIVETWQ